jgi:hypothetical protein
VGRAGFCINHPGRPADIRCAQCRKPLCADCIIQDEGDPFCSKRCASRYRAVHRSYEQARAKLPARTVIGRVAAGVLIAAIVLLILGVAGRAGWGPAKPVYRLVFRLFLGR